LKFSGGPLFGEGYKNDAGVPVFYQFGIASFGPRCDKNKPPSSPSVYTDVYEFIEWIEEKIKMNQNNQF
jgi:secreted trypsin-like serine protease